MKCDVVIDLQFGSTAKGKVVQYLSEKNNYSACVRVQSIQAGHTVHYKNKFYKMRTIPCAWVNLNTYLLIGAGQFLEKELLLAEVEMLKDVCPNLKSRLLIDYRATYITEDDIKAESENKLTSKIGSTSEGAGSSLIRKIWRKDKPTRVCDDNWAKQNEFKVVDTVKFMNMCDSVLVEGSQGTLLSVHTSPYYPFCTSRECTASGIISEAGISPIDVRNIYGVFRTYPIRVGGNSGDTGGIELSWEQMAKRSGNKKLKPEVTTVTNRDRRIFEFSLKDMRHSILLNKPTKFCMTFIDYINHKDYGKTSWFNLSKKSKEFCRDIEYRLGIELDWLSTGEKINHCIKL